MLTLSRVSMPLQVTGGVLVFEWQVFRGGELLGSGASIFDALAQIGGKS